MFIRSKIIQFPAIAYIQSCTRLLLFGTFELAISMPVEVGKSLIVPHLKDMSNIYLEQEDQDPSLTFKYSISI